MTDGKVEGIAPDVLHALLAQAYERSSQSDQAKQALRQAIALKPDNMNLRVVLSRLLMQKGRSQEARSLAS
ncbi:MAG: hypothetical protein FD153_1025 [Rhodospirillaceae bacterium]|nr:MAG: hypothetical protein FD153_1025 [Rhodospirillaceae bacterium]